MGLHSEAMPEDRLGRTRKAYLERPTLRAAIESVMCVAVRCAQSDDEALRILEDYDPASAALARRLASGSTNIWE